MSAAVAMLKIHRRDEWGSAWPHLYARNARLSGPLDEHMVHTGAVEVWPTTLAQGMAYMRRDERYHVQTHGWSGIGYNHLIDLAGNIYEGRGWLRAGAHTEQGRNTSAHATQLMGHGDLREATPEQIRALGELIREGIRVGAIVDDPWISPHAMYSAKGKTCPGTKIQRQLGISKTVRRRFSAIAALQPEPEPQPSEEDEMRLYIAHAPGGSVWLCNPATGSRMHIDHPDRLRQWLQLGEREVLEVDRDWLWIGSFENLDFVRIPAGAGQEGDQVVVRGGREHLAHLLGEIDSNTEPATLDDAAAQLEAASSPPATQAVSGVGGIDSRESFGTPGGDS